jgi:hypothetical protein
MSAQKPPAGGAVAAPGEQEGQGLWAYETIGKGDGPYMRLDGYLLIRDGMLVQNSLGTGEPSDRQVAQAHAGPYRAVGRQLHLTAEVGLVVDPKRDPGVSFGAGKQHVITVDRVGDNLTLTFGSGTVQKFKRVGPGTGEVHVLDKGALALVDGRFLLVAETPERAVAGSGLFERSGQVVRFHAERWFSVHDGRPTYRAPGLIEAIFDGRELKLMDGIVFRVKK